MPKTLNYKPLDLDLELLNAYVKSTSKMSKEELIRKIAGEVPREFLNLMKLLKFYFIGKDSSGQVYIV